MQTVGVWLANGGPTCCFHCQQPFPHSEDGAHIQAQVGRDKRLYCFGTFCEADALEAAAIKKRRLS